jgi:2-aminoethylphosphonate-pyruvate transaminase
VAHGEASHTAVPIQGSGTYVLEAAIATLVGPDDGLLVLINGAYGERMATIARRLGRSVEPLSWPENQPIDPVMVEAALAEDPSLTYVAVVHCETTTGLLNPLEAIAEVVAKAGRTLIVDAMSSFGALPIDLRTLKAGAVLASSNKCLEGAPGIAFALVEAGLLSRSAGRSPSVSLDLHAQWQGFETNGQWRFTPPVQVAAALVEALRRLEAEGGSKARLARYTANFQTLYQATTALGLQLYLDPSVQAPIIATFRPPSGPFRFETFYDVLAARGFIIYPGKLTKEPSFRIGCIGAVTPADFERLAVALGPALREATAS